MREQQRRRVRVAKLLDVDVDIVGTQPAPLLRCGLLWEDGARLYAGVGVMPDSDPARELEETELKFKALLTALI